MEEEEEEEEEDHDEEGLPCEPDETRSNTTSLQNGREHPEPHAHILMGSNCYCTAQHYHMLQQTVTKS